MVMSELNTNLTAEEREKGVVSKAIRNHVYTVENYGYNDYRVIGKKRID